MKIINFEENKIILAEEEKFVVNNLTPVGFRELTKNNFVFLFLANQDFDDKVMYLQLFFAASNQFEYDALKKHPNYIKNYKDNKESSDMYKQMIAGMKQDNLFVTDFIMNRNQDYPFYYNSYAYRAIDDVNLKKLNLFIPRNTFIKIKCMLENYNIRSSLLPTSLMYKLNIQNVRFALVEKIKNFGSIMVNDGGKEYIDTHYGIKAENKVYEVNYRSKRKSNQLPLNVLDNETFSKCKDDYYLEYFFLFEDKLYIVYPEKENDKIILILNKDQINSTNFINQYNTIFKEETK
jgi:hypothetical protein